MSKYWSVFIWQRLPQTSQAEYFRCKREHYTSLSVWGWDEAFCIASGVVLDRLLTWNSSRWQTALFPDSVFWDFQAWAAWGLSWQQSVPPSPKQLLLPGNFAVFEWTLPQEFLQSAGLLEKHQGWRPGRPICTSYWKPAARMMMKRHFHITVVKWRKLLLLL